MSTKALAAFNAFACNAADDSSAPEVVSAALVVITFVSMQLGRSAARATSESFDGRQRVQTPFKQHGVVAVCTAHQYHQRDASGVYDDVSFGAEFASVRGVRTGLRAPLGLGVDEPSMLARLQSIWSYSRRCSSIAR